MEEDGAEIVVCANEFGIDSIDVFHPESIIYLNRADLHQLKALPFIEISSGGKDG